MEANLVLSFKEVQSLNIGDEVYLERNPATTNTGNDSYGVHTMAEYDGSASEHRGEHVLLSDDYGEDGGSFQLLSDQFAPYYEYSYRIWRLPVRPTMKESRSITWKKEPK